MKGLGDFIEASPIATLTLTEGLIGAALGGLVGWSVGKLISSKNFTPLVAGAALGGAAAAANGYHDGQELSSWMKASCGT